MRQKKLKKSMNIDFHVIVQCKLGKRKFCLITSYKIINYD